MVLFDKIEKRVGPPARLSDIDLDVVHQVWAEMEVLLQMAICLVPRDNLQVLSRTY